MTVAGKHIEKGEASYGARVPDLPGCIAAAETEEEVLRLIKEASGLHIQDLKARGEPVPAPSSTVRTVPIDAG